MTVWARVPWYMIVCIYCVPGILGKVAGVMPFHHLVSCTSSSENMKKKINIHFFSSMSVLFDFLRLLYLTEFHTACYTILVKTLRSYPDSIKHLKTINNKLKFIKYLYLKLEYRRLIPDYKLYSLYLRFHLLFRFSGHCYSIASYVRLENIDVFFDQ